MGLNGKELNMTLVVNPQQVISAAPATLPTPVPTVALPTAAPAAGVNPADMPSDYMAAVAISL